MTWLVSYRLEGMENTEIIEQHPAIWWEGRTHKPVVFFALEYHQAMRVGGRVGRVFKEEARRKEILIGKPKRTHLKTVV